MINKRLFIRADHEGNFCWSTNKFSGDKKSQQTSMDTASLWINLFLINPVNSLSSHESESCSPLNDFKEIFHEKYCPNLNFLYKNNDVVSTFLT